MNPETNEIMHPLIRKHVKMDIKSIATKMFIHYP